MSAEPMDDRVQKLLGLDDAQYKAWLDLVYSKENIEKHGDLPEQLRGEG